MAAHQKKKQQAPFYEVPSTVTASSRIIDEARKSLRAVPISRPYTPANDGRHLFTSTSSRTRRPPSVFSIGNGQYNEEPYNRPFSAQKLPPIQSQETPDVYDTSVSVPSSRITSPCDPILKTSKSSPTTSHRVLSAEENPCNNEIKQRSNDTDIKLMDTNDIKLSELSSANTEKVAMKQSNQLNSDKTKLSKTEVNQIWDTQIQPLLVALDPSNTDTNQLCTTCNELLQLLKNYNLLGKTGGFAGSRKRSSLLRTVFGILSHKDSVLLMKLSKIILEMQVTGSNLLNVCKLVFSLSRDEKNDTLFITEEIIVPLINTLTNTDPNTNHEIMVYGLGTVKLLAGNPKIREELSQNELCVKLLSDCLQKCTEIKQYKDTTANVLVQLISALRNLSDIGSVYKQFIQYSIPQHISTVLHIYHTNPELVFIISRLLSKLTLAEECCIAISQSFELISLLPGLLLTHLNYEDIVVRVCFILNNILSDSPNVCLKLCQSSDSPLLNSINQVLENYLDRLKNENMNSKLIDVLIKSVSLLANISVHSGVATCINDNENTIVGLLVILETITLSQSEVLLVNTLATINNLSFYSQDTLTKYQDRLMEILTQGLNPTSHNVLLECTRVLGNLTRQESIRSLLRAKRVDELLITLLDSKHIALVYSVCGVLVNLMANEQHQDILKTNNGIKKLLDVLGHFGRQDWILASLSCQVIWNYSKGMANISDSFNKEETVILFHLLEEYLDPVTAFNSYMVEHESSADISNQQYWNTHFVPVATNIISKLREEETPTN